MGRTFIFDCEKCGYQARAAGGLAEGLDVVAQTVHCTDCRALYDAVTAIRVPIEESHSRAPRLEEIIARLQLTDRDSLRWQHFEPACPVAADHEVQEWRHPGKCPLCATFMEPSGLPFRVWN
jgi:hypothetical protein